MVLALNLGVSNMITWHDHQSNYKNLNNVKVKQRFQRRWTWHIKGATTVGIQPRYIWQYVRDWLEEGWLKMTWNKTWNEQMINISTCTEVEMLQTKGQIDFGSGDHTLSTWVAQNFMGTSPLQSLQKTAPRPYIIWQRLNFTNTVAIQLNFRGWVQELHYMHFERGSNGQTIITMQFLGGNYPKSIYGMGNFEIEQTWQNSKKY